MTNRHGKEQMQNRNPMVTVVIPTPTVPTWWGARSSALFQTITDLEVIVVIDGPDPSTVSVLEDIRVPTRICAFYLCLKTLGDPTRATRELKARKENGLRCSTTTTNGYPRSLKSNWNWAILFASFSSDLLPDYRENTSRII